MTCVGLGVLHRPGTHTLTWPDFTYEYDRVGNISKMTTVSTAGTDTQSFGYDHLHRLLTASAAGGVANYNHTYAYDKLGNIDYRVDSGNMLDYTYGAKPHAVTAVSGDDGMALTYDANGNMTRRIEGGVTYNQVFDVENRIILVNPVTGGSTGFFYDAGGQRVKTLQPNGTLIYTPYPTYEEEVRPTILFQADFESGGEMSEIKSSSFPMSSLWRSNWGAAAPASGAHGYAFSNHAYGYVQSDAITVTANTQYDLYAWVRGQLDPDDRAGAWLIRAYYYNSSGGGISYQDIASNQGSLTTTWQEKGGRITTPAGTATLRIQLYNYSNSGWVAFDDVRLNPVNGRNLVVNPGFESSSGWSGIASASFPGTSLWRGSSGPSAPRSGSYSYSISNLANGFLRSDAFAVTANTQYDLYAWVRGEIDPDKGTPVSRWVIRAQFFNSSGGSLGYIDADSGNPGSLNTTWRQEGGRITTPANTASVRIELYNYLNSGWVVFDDVTFIKVGTSVNLAPNPGFESSGGWGASPSSAFPGTSLWRSTWGVSGPRSGANAYSISNHPYAYLQSASLPVTGGAQYDLYAWVRGKLDADDSTSSFYLRLRFYDSSGAPIPYESGHNAHSGSPESLDGVWRYSGGRVTAPPNAATVQILLLNHFNTGWVTFDDVLLTRVGQETVIKRSSYGIAGQIAAIRISGDPANNGLHYLYSDHLGSASAIQKDDGSAPIITRYLPFGGYRAGSGPNQVTDRGFTGQPENMDLGLLYYQARFYVPGLGRFASADTIVPNPANPQQYNRYTYTLNNPLRYTDPTGHVCYDPGLDAVMPGNCNGGSTPLPPFPVPAPPSPLGDPLKGFYEAGYAYKPDAERKGDYHNGRDLVSDITTDLKAIATGHVRVADACTVCRGGGRSANANFGVGNVVIIEYAYDVIPANIREALGLAKGDSVYIQYQHLEVIDESNFVGKEVRLGDIVGQYGNTGLSEGAHLHLEVHVGTAGALGTGNGDGTYDTHSNAWHTLTIVDPRLIWNIPWTSP